MVGFYNEMDPIGLKSGWVRKAIAFLPDWSDQRRRHVVASLVVKYTEEVTAKHQLPSTEYNVK